MPLPQTMSCSSCSMKLLARSRLRSDDPEAAHLGSAQPPADRPIHPFTGTFASPDLTAAFGPNVFQLMLPLHVVGLALLVWSGAYFVLESCSEHASVSAMATRLFQTSIGALGLAARIALHRWEDQAKAQRYGTIAWTTGGISTCIADLVIYVLDSKAYVLGTYGSPLLYAAFALLNASQGMEFWHTTLLTCLTLCKQTARQTASGISPAPCNLVLIAVGTAGHFAQLLARRAFLQAEHLQTSRERLDYDVRRLECGMQRLWTRIPAVNRKSAVRSAISESSAASTVAAPSRASRSVRSAPAVMRRLQFAPPHPPGPSTMSAAATGPSTTHPSTAAVLAHSCVANGSQAGPSTSADVGPPAAAPGAHLDDLALLDLPAFTLSGPELAQLLQLRAQMQAEWLSAKDDDEASDGLSQHGSAAPPLGSAWSSSAPSTSTRNRRRMNRAIYELRHGISAPASASDSWRCSLSV